MAQHGDRVTSRRDDCEYVIDLALQAVNGTISALTVRASIHRAHREVPLEVASPR
jgi:hypothetical protein